MDRVKKIEDEINLLEKELSEVKGRETEVYTRIVGYYRAVKNWNKGKREEYNHRVCFSSLHNEKVVWTNNDEEKNVNPFEQKSEDEISSYSYFFRKTCPSCPSVKKYLDKLEINGEAVDVDTPDGISIAREKGILSVPTVIFSNNQRKEIYRARNIKDLKESASSSLAFCTV
ncbi:MAG: thiol reductase thioredoxin [Spirochaetaceae bacterium]|nr:thiol reductase thioredoxin [Spirochaetaceae bacterium]